MRHSILCAGPVFRLESWGGGLSYELTHIASGDSAFMQGDDAGQFETERENAERAFPEKTDDEICAWLWDQCEYSCAAQPQRASDTEIQDRLRDEIANSGEC